MSDAESIGTVLTGGIVAREFDQGEAAGHDEHEGAGGTCFNCGAIRTGPFCQACGQSGHIHRNIVALGHDLAHGVFHFEGKFWSTLPLLIAKPGHLTRRYIHGERVKFVSPMALFLFSIFLLFAAVNRLAMPDMSGASAGIAKARVEMGKAATESAKNLADLQKERADRLADNPKADVTKLDKRIKSEQADVDAMRNLSAQLPRQEKSDNGSYGLLDGDKQGVHSSIPWLDRQLRGINENSALYAYKLKMASYKYSWALIPISVPFIWMLFFWRRDVGLYDHAIFAIHSLSFMTLLVVGLLGLYFIGVPQGFLWTAFVFAPPIHMYKHLKYAYQTGRFGAFWRMCTLMVMTSFTSVLFFLFLVWLEAE